LWPGLRVHNQAEVALESRKPFAEAFHYSLYRILLARYISSVTWDVEFTDEFGRWWEGLCEEEQDSVDHYVRLLMDFGPSLSRPYTDAVKGSEFGNMKELRVQHEGRPYRVLYAFDPRARRSFCWAAIRLGTPVGTKRWCPRLMRSLRSTCGNWLSNSKG
jgi:hypothetical protein